jgi:hypothetical protein
MIFGFLLPSSFPGRKTSLKPSDRIAVEAKQRSVPTYWIIGFFVFANTMICYFDRVNFSVAAPTIMKGQRGQVSTFNNLVLKLRCHPEKSWSFSKARIAHGAWRVALRLKAL